MPTVTILAIFFKAIVVKLGDIGCYMPTF